MIRVFNRPVSIRLIALAIIEILLVFAAPLLAYWTGMGQHLPPRRITYGQVGVLGSVILFCMYCLDFYEPQVTIHERHSLSRSIQAIGLTTLIIAAMPYGWRASIDSVTILFAMLLVGAGLTASRSLFAELVRIPTLAEPAVVWGSGRLAASLIRELRRRPDLGLRILGIVDQTYAGDSFAGVRYIGSPEALWSLAESGQARRIIIAIGERRGSLPVDKLMALKAAGLTIDDGTELYEELTGKVWLGTFSTSLLLFSRRCSASAVKRFLTRSLSMFFAVFALIIAAPVMLIVAFLIRLDSVGPAIFRQTRVGENGQHFTLYKFRSMKVYSDPVGSPAPATRDDPRCTRIGKWLRRFRVDELPQLFNILKGDMCFVGPRPFVLDQENELVHQIPHYHQRWTVRPGATGWAQVHRGYCSSVEDNADKLSYDLFYIKNLSMTLDVVTLVKTVKIVLLGRGAR